MTAVKERAPQADEQDKRAALFEVAADFIRHNIAEGHLYEGLVLQESALSERLEMSRATVKRALEMIETEGLIRKFSGRGFLVAGPAAEVKRDDLRSLELDTSILDASSGKPNWLRVYDEVAYHVTRCPVFGRYRVLEAQMAEEYGVSRTIIRDVLGRLQERGLVQKSRTSRWIVAPLTSQRIKDKYELRSILEVAALTSAKLPVDKLNAFAQEVRDLPAGAPLTPERWFALERRFFEMTVLTSANEDLTEYAATNRVALEACQSALFSLGLPPDTQSIVELGRVVELALSGSLPAATSMLTMHLEKACHRTVAQLKITAILPPPTDFPPYLQLS